jgi:hypothetical protein
MDQGREAVLLDQSISVVTSEREKEAVSFDTDSLADINYLIFDLKSDYNEQFPITPQATEDTESKRDAYRL